MSVHRRTDLVPTKAYAAGFMKQPIQQPESISELIDTRDRIREELFTVQRSLERMEEDGMQKDPSTSMRAT
jgi:hypothetical protein